METADWQSDVPPAAPIASTSISTCMPSKDDLILDELTAPSPNSSMSIVSLDVVDLTSFDEPDLQDQKVLLFLIRCDMRHDFAPHF